MQLAEVVQASRDVSATSSRKEKTEHLATLLSHADPGEVETVVGFLVGQPKQGRLGVGHKTVSGLAVAPAAEATLSIADVDRTFDALKATTGPGSGAARAELLQALMGRSTADEQRFLIGLMLGEVRQGALAGVLLEAVAQAARLDAPGVRRAAMLSGNLAAVARDALFEGASTLDQYRIELLRPLGPMLAQTAESPADALERTGTAAFEYKLDGARIQVHRDGDDVRVFTRNLNDVTQAVPEVVEAVRALPVRSIILDGEAIALRADGRPQPFQTTMRRFGRKLEVERLRNELPLAPYFFDCLHLDGTDFIDASAAERAEALETMVAEPLRVPRIVTASAEEANAFLTRALRAGHEGIVAKSLDALYEAGRRGAGWLKIKPSHTLDLVVLAVEWGSGRRKGFLSNLHLGARDPASGRFVMLGKTFKGMTDEMLRWQTEHLLGLEVRRDGHVLVVRPELVVEIAFDGIQQSPQYPGGLALRFARVRRYRPDKTAAESDTLDTVRALYESRGGAAS